MGVSSLATTVTRQRRGYDLNPGSSVPESSTLTTRLLPCPHSIPSICWESDRLSVCLSRRLLWPIDALSYFLTMVSI